MPTYSCEIRRGDRVVYQGETTSPTGGRARSNAWWRYAKSEGVPNARFRLFVSKQMGDGFACYCQKEPDIPLDVEPPEKPSVSTHQQLELPFEERLGTALQQVFERR